jgi:hypothetical protein
MSNNQDLFGTGMFEYIGKPDIKKIFGNNSYHIKMISRLEVNE